MARHILPGIPCMSDKVFVDTNILVYARDAACPEKQEICKKLLARLWKNRAGRLSVQVCNEFYVTVTRKLKPGMDEYSAWHEIELYSAWDPEPLDYETLRKAREVQNYYQLSWWDSLIVAAAFFAECGTIVSEDLNSGQDYLGIKVVNPFLQPVDNQD
jgi:predicted nucleic acid-binding protein